MKIRKIMYILFVLLFISFISRDVQADDDVDEIVVYHYTHSDSEERYFNILQIDMNVTNHSYGSWEFWYSNDGVNFRKDYQSEILQSVGSYPVDYKLYDIAGAAPDKPTNGTIAYSSGSTWYCPVSAKANSTLLYYKLYATWEDSTKELFSSMPATGYKTEEIQDKVKGFYYIIDGNSTSNFSVGESGVKFTSSVNLTFDVSDFGKYMHVRAVSCSGKVSKILTIYLNPTVPGIPRTVSVTAGDGVSSTTGRGKYLPGQMVTVSAELEEYYQFSGWSGTYNSKEQTYTFQMPNKNVALTASAERPSYILAYDAMGGTGAPQSQTILAGTSGEISSEKPARSNYTFVEWNEAGDGSGKGYQPGDTIALTENITLFAIWKADTYTIRLHANKPSTASSKVEHGEDAYGKKTVQLKDATASQRGEAGVAYFGTITTGIDKMYYVYGSTYSNIPYGLHIDRGDNVYCDGTEGISLYDSNGKSTYVYLDDVPGLSLDINRKSFQKYTYGYNSSGNFTQLEVTGNKKYIGAVVYDNRSGHYYKLRELGNENYEMRADIFNSYTFGSITYSSCWDDLGDSYPITLDEGWTWYSTNSDAGEGYYEKSFTKNSTAVLPSSSDVFRLIGWHPVNSKLSLDAAGTSWITSRNLDGKYYAAGTKVTALALTDATSKTIDLYAPWYNNTYKVYFYANGGSGSMASVTYMYDDIEERKLPSNTFEKSGATFEYWKMYSPSSPYIVNNEGKVSNWCSVNNGTVNLYAVWKEGEITYNLSFHGNGADGGSTQPIQNITYNQQVTIPENGFYKQGYDFAGWLRVPRTYEEYLADKGKNQIIKPGKTVSRLTNIQGETVTYYALWRPKGMDENGNPVHYTIRFDGNGAERGSVSDISAEYHQSVILAENKFERLNYHFTSWNTKADGSGISYAEYQEVMNLADTEGAEVVLYAQWQIDQYTIRFDGNGASSGSMSDMKLNHGEKRELSENKYQRTGYHFSGWNTEADGSGTSYSDRTMVVNLANGNGSVRILYAQWIPAECTLCFDGNGADIGSMGKLSVPYETAKVLPENQYQRKGYDFIGWNTRADGSGDYYCAGDMYQNLNPEDNVEIVLYAQWKGISYSVRFDGNGADSGNMADQSMIYGEKTALNGNSYLKTGYQFMTWNTEADGSGISYQDKEMVMNLTDAEGEIITLYAQWKDIEPPVIENITEEPPLPQTDESFLEYDWVNYNMELKFNGIDLGTGMKRMYFENEEGKIIRTGFEYINLLVRTEGITKRTLYAIDNAENTAILYVTVKIDKTAPVIAAEDSYEFSPEGTLHLDITTEDAGGSGLKDFVLYEGEGDNLAKIAESTDISGNTGSLSYDFTDDSSKAYQAYTLVATDHAGNVTTKTIKIYPDSGLSATIHKSSGKTAGAGEVLEYVQYGDRRAWFDVELEGFLTEVTYDFCDELNALGMEDVTHSVSPAATAQDALQVEIPKYDQLEFDREYPIVITGRREGKEVSVTLAFKAVKFDFSKIKVVVRYQEGMAMPKKGGTWIDYRDYYKKFLKEEE